MNLVFQDENSKIPMTKDELTEVFNALLPRSRKIEYDLNRLSGNHCRCNGKGEFVLLPETD